MSYKQNSRDSSHNMRYARSNVSEFVLASREILNYLRILRLLPNVDDAEWEPFSTRLADAFLKKYKHDDDFSKHRDNWNSIFPEYLYRFDKKSVENQFELTGINLYSDSFYYYNYFACRHLISIYGSKPRST